MVDYEKLLEQIVGGDIEIHTIVQRGRDRYAVIFKFGAVVETDEAMMERFRSANAASKDADLTALFR